MSLADLETIGISRMTHEEVLDFLRSQGVGVLGLPAGSSPYLLPMSFGFDGEESLYFTYVTGGGSRKVDLSEESERATFLIYDATTKYMWESVSLTGTIEAVPESEWDAIDDALDNAWRPSVFEEGDRGCDVAVYRFRIEDRAGYKQNGLPPAFEATPTDEESG